MTLNFESNNNPGVFTNPMIGWLIVCEYVACRNIFHHEQKESEVSDSSNLVSIIEFLLFQEYLVLEKVLSKGLDLKPWQRQYFVFT